MKKFKLFWRKGQPKSKNEEKEKKTKNNRKVSFSRQKASRAASLIFFSVIALSLLFNVIFFSKYQTIRNSVKAQQSSIEERIGDVGKADMITSDAVISYTNDFLESYFTIPNDEEEREERMEELSTFYVKGFDTSGLQPEGFKGSRSIEDLAYLKTDRINGEKTKVHYQVTYEVREEVEDEDPRTVLNQVEVIVPVVTDGGGYAVYENVRIVQSDLKASIPLEEQELEGEDVTSTDQDSIQSFLENFFTSYGVSDDKLPFMASVEKGLSNQVFESATVQQLVSREEGYEVIADVEYKDQETSLTSSYTYELELSETQNETNNYYVETIQ
ncbi:conjugal transfer protein [Halobacillus sp. A5]|uniref:conjugal transfer protein n=1 Tax=Halobacillus sp. A5 TaxID=2880263 RepID=UPI0020A62256|nr:conjugal transfer protein [Halobacillus sp. A5]MCP3029663.1 conjugal transfer protein [Halobacillus sp. A5]